MRLAYLVPHVRVQQGACLSTEACCPDQGSRLLPVLIEARWFSVKMLSDCEWLAYYATASHRVS